MNAPDCGWGVYVPSAFSPDNDGKNDVLRPVVLGSVKKYVFTVFDRWGTIIYQTKQTDQGWDGMYKNQPANIGAYVWMCEYELKGD
ncbi:gliding motility-associated C-terminal domain-containing protein [Chitinophaga sancti]|uniref:T9SS type B sorting domain-containing protein n=1 Tax=Chitinophaga sancti TaxID=1004 RepID=UPI003F7A634A